MVLIQSQCIYRCLIALSPPKLCFQHLMSYGILSPSCSSLPSPAPFSFPPSFHNCFSRVFIYLHTWPKILQPQKYKLESQTQLCSHSNSQTPLGKITRYLDSIRKLSSISSPLCCVCYCESVLVRLLEAGGGCCFSNMCL